MSFSASSDRQASCQSKTVMTFHARDEMIWTFKDGVGFHDDVFCLKQPSLSGGAMVDERRKATAADGWGDVTTTQPAGAGLSVSVGRNKEACGVRGEVSDASEDVLARSSSLTNVAASPLFPTETVPTRPVLAASILSQRAGGSTYPDQAGTEASCPQTQESFSSGGNTAHSSQGATSGPAGSGEGSRRLPWTEIELDRRQIIVPSLFDVSLISFATLRTLHFMFKKPIITHDMC